MLLSYEGWDMRMDGLFENSVSKKNKTLSSKEYMKTCKSEGFLTFWFYAEEGEGGRN